MRNACPRSLLSRSDDLGRPALTHISRPAIPLPFRIASTLPLRGLIHGPLFTIARLADDICRQFGGARVGRQCVPEVPPRPRNGESEETLGSGGSTRARTIKTKHGART